MYEAILRLDFDYFFRLDDDSVPLLGNIYALTTTVFSTRGGRPDYIGANLVAADPNPPAGKRQWHYGKVSDKSLNTPYAGDFTNPYLAGGHGVLLSRKAIELIVARGKNQFFDPGEIYEDKSHGDVLAAEGISPRRCGSKLVVTDIPAHRIPQEFHIQNGKSVLPSASAPVWKGRILSRREMERPGSARPLFYACHKKKFLYLSVAKCGCSTMKSLIHQLDIGEVPNRQDIHDVFGYKVDHSRLFPISPPNPKMEGYLRFVVCRDPVERLVSCFINRVCGPGKQNRFYALIHGCGFDDFLDVCSKILADVKPENMDEHLRPQYHFFKPADVDHIVPLEDLDLFLEQELGIDPPKRENVTNSNRFRPTPEQQERILEFYHEDTKIVPTWRPRKSHELAHCTR